MTGRVYGSNVELRIGGEKVDVEGLSFEACDPCDDDGDATAFVVATSHEASFTIEYELARPMVAADIENAVAKLRERSVAALDGYYYAAVHWSYLLMFECWEISAKLPTERARILLDELSPSRAPSSSPRPRLAHRA